MALSRLLFREGERQGEGTGLAGSLVVHRGLDLVIAGGNGGEVIHDFDEELMVLDPAAQLRAGKGLLAADQPSILRPHLEIERQVDDIQLAVLAKSIAYGLGIEDDL